MGNKIYNRQCDFCGIVYIGSGKKFCSNKCIGLSKKNKHISQETKDKISETHQKNQKNKGKKLSTETKKKISESGKKVWENEEYREKMSNIHKGHIVTDETKEKIRSSNIGKKKPGVSEYNRTRKKVEGWKHTEEAKSKISLGVKGINNGMYGKTPTYSNYSLYENRDIIIKMRSTWEVLFAKYLDSINKKWEYESKCFELEGCTYTPDFLSDGIFYEVKGFLHEHSKIKIEKFRELYPNIELIIIDRDKMKELKLIK